MATSTLKTRIKHKTGTAAEWQTAATNSQFKPLEGELIIYESATTPRLKVGDGSSLVTALPFVGGNPIVSITRSGLTFTATHVDGTTSAFSQQDNNTIYTHPSHTAKSSGLYKITVDNQGHVSAATAVTKADITGLGIPGSASSVTLNGTSTTSASFYAPTSAGTAGYVLKSNGSGAPTWATEYSYTLPTATSSVLGGVKVGSNITVSSGTISLTKANVTAALGYTPPTSDTNTTYSAGTGISLSGTTFSNSGVRSISTGSSNGTISVNTNGTSANVAVKGLGSAAYLASTDLIHSVSLATDGSLRVNNGSGTSILYLDNYYLKLSGGTLTGNINIQGAYYPSFCLQPTTANNAGTYTGGFFEGSYVDNVSMWVWTDRTNSAKSRRGLVLKGYAEQANDNQALVMRRCDTSGNWQSDLNILHSGNYSSYALPLSGGAMTGRITQIYGTPAGSIGNMYTSAAIQIRENNLVGSSQSNILYAPTLGFHWSGLVACNLSLAADGYLCLYNNGGNLSGFKAGTVYGAVWNDYAEYRSQNETIEPGYITYCDDDGKLKKTVKRLQKYEGVVSDTFGFAIGETDDCKTPLAVSGRALVYCDPEEEHFHSGDCVCAGPDGLAYRMTREEIIEFPDRIVGIVSEIPTYETWGTGNVEVNGRIWIKVK